MKKLCILAAMLLVSLSALNAQEAFKHVSLGLDLGTTGAGLQVAVPVVTDHLVFKAGFNYLAFPYNTGTNISTGDLPKTVSNANSKIAEANQKLAPYGERIQTTLSSNFASSYNMDIAAKANLSNIKALFEFYPSAKSSFHITAGVYAGLSENLVDITLSLDNRFWSEVDRLNADVNSLRSEVDALKSKYSEEVGNVEIPEVPSELKISMSDKTYSVRKGGNLDAGVKTLQVRPYLGLGFGRSVPDGHFGFQVDLGAWYHGTPQLTSPNQTSYDSSAPKAKFNLDVIEKVPVYPVLSLQLFYRIF